MWRLGFFFHEMAFGLLSIFLPLYILTVGGSLVDIGIMSAFALLSAIPASFFWGHICDKTRHYKRYILISFFSAAITLYFFTLTTSIGLLIILYVATSILHLAHEPPKNVLIAELYAREEWEKTFAFYEGFTETGWLIGLLLGFFMSIHGSNATSTLLICSSLNLVAFVISLAVVADPVFVFERSLVSIERTIDFTSRGVTLASKILDGISLNERLRRENIGVFCCGLVLFSLATSMLFTPLPVFFSRDLALSASVVFAIYALNSLGGVVGYFLAGNKLKPPLEKSAVSRVVLFRGVLVFLLLTIMQTAVYGVFLATGVLVMLGFAYALFLVFTLSLSMELIPQGKAGLFNALVGLGGACGSLFGPLIAEVLGFQYIFFITGVIFLFAYIAFKTFA